MHTLRLGNQGGQEDECCAGLVWFWVGNEGKTNQKE